MKTTGDIIRKKREKKGLSLKDVSQATGIDASIICKIEKNERFATSEQLEKLSKFLELDDDKILTHYLSDKIVKMLEHQPFASEVIRMAEKKIRQIKSEE